MTSGLEMVVDKGPPLRIRTIGGWWVWLGPLPLSGVPVMGEGEYVFEYEAIHD
jgi:hypothetical protein